MNGKKVNVFNFQFETILGENNIKIRNNFIIIVEKMLIALKN